MIELQRKSIILEDYKNNGNLKVISKLLEGATVEEIEEKLLGNTCGRRPASCTDQLAKAVREAYNEYNK